jgi:pantetheine-phosphate adenylyltransferase
VRRAACPGSFDPVTNGHLDIVSRPPGCSTRWWSPSESTRRRTGCSARGAHRDAREACATSRTSGRRLHGLLTDFCREHDVAAIVKGLRAVSDFDYELRWPR